MKVNTIQCKSLLGKSNLPEVDYCINPYVGCQHGCLYCYARFMRRFTSHSERWGEFVDVKINAPEILTKELSHQPRRGIVLLGSMTDAYQPVERKYKITRTVLELLLAHEFPVSILTKSDLVLRDIDLLRQFSDCEVGLTITIMNKEASSDFELYSSSPGQRLRALETLHRAGVKTYAFVGPILPGFTDLRSVYTALQGKVDFVMAESLNMRCGNRKDIMALLGKKYPNLLSLYHPKFKQGYWDQIEEELRKLSAEFNVPLKGFYQH